MFRIQDDLRAGMLTGVEPVVSHGMGFIARLSTRVVFLDHGVVVQAAPPAELFGQQAEPRVRSFLQT